MRRISGKRTIANLLVDRRSDSGHHISDAINKYSPRTIVLSSSQCNVNQGIPGESDRGNTGEFGQEREELEDEKDGRPKKKGTPSPAHG